MAIINRNWGENDVLNSEFIIYYYFFKECIDKYNRSLKINLLVH